MLVLPRRAHCARLRLQVSAKQSPCRETSAQLRARVRSQRHGQPPLHDEGNPSRRALLLPFLRRTLAMAKSAEGTSAKYAETTFMLPPSLTSFQQADYVTEQMAETTGRRTVPSWSLFFSLAVYFPVLMMPMTAPETGSIFLTGEAGPRDPKARSSASWKCLVTKARYSAKDCFFFAFLDCLR